MRFSDFVTVVPRFTRAINLERDFSIPGAIDGYIVTPAACNVLERLAQALHVSSGHRAWTLTGPYGSGKSAFALYLANLLGPAESTGGGLARTILRCQKPQLHKALTDRRARR